MKEVWNVDTRTVKTDSIAATRARAVAKIIIEIFSLLPLLDFSSLIFIQQ